MDAHGVSLGRALGNDIVVNDPATSQLHAIAHLGAFGPELLVFGRNGTRVNGVGVDGPTALGDGDRIEVPGEVLTVHVEGRGKREGAVQWVLARPDGSLYGLRHEVRVGGGADDDLCVPGWPAGAVLLSPVQGALVLTLAVDAQVGGDEVAAGALRTARVGDEVVIGHTGVRLFGEASPCPVRTAIAPEALLPSAVAFAFLPSGARLTLRFEHRDVTLRLSEVRARLVATLLGAGADIRPGDWVIDDLVIPRVWPRQEGKTRVDVNILVHRLRRDLLKRGLDPFAVIEREERATRFLVATGGTVHVE